MKNSKSIRILWAIALLAVCCSLIGCGGGGGGSGIFSTAGDGTNSGTTGTLPTSSTVTPIPTNFSSSAFPEQAKTVSPVPSDGISNVVLVNSTAQAVSVPLTATVGPLAAKIGSTDDSKDSTTMNNSVLADNTKDKQFHSYLRYLEKHMPGASSVSSNKVLTSAAIRTDTVGGQVSFSVIANDMQSAKTVTATCKMRKSLPTGVGYVNFYFDNNVTYDGTAESFANELNNDWSQVYTKVRATFGSEPPASFNSIGDDITVLISPPSVVETAGFFYSGDLYAPSQLTTKISNQRKMFYLQYDPENLTADTLASTMAHEFQHMVNFYQRKLNGLTEEDWLNEAMAGYSEHVCGYTFVNKKNQSKALQINKFFAAIETLPLVVTPWPGEHANYGQVYLFGTYLGEHLPKDKSLASLLTSTKIGTGAVQELTGETFDQTFAKWMLALQVNDTTGGTYGFKDINLRTTYTFAEGLKDVTLTGPATRINKGSFPYSTGNITIGAYTSAYVQLTGAGGSPINITLPAGVAGYEMHQ